MIGVLAHDFIKEVLFESPALIAVMLILGGIVLLVVDKTAPEPRHLDAMRLPVPLAFRIGVIQCPGHDPRRLAVGSDHRGRADDGRRQSGRRPNSSFFLSMPTMAGAVAYDLYKNRDVLNSGDVETIGLGFVCAFISAILVVRWLLNYVSRKGYALFGWWRIAVGVVTLAALAAGL